MDKLILFRLLDFVSITFYAIVFVMSLIGAILYCSAYKQMKRTKIIGAVAILLFSICFDTGWWMLTEFVRFTSGTHSYEMWMVHPLVLILTKIVLGFGVIFFVTTSVKNRR